MSSMSRTENTSVSSVFSGTPAIAWVMWLLVSLFFAYQYILRVMPNIIMTDVMQQFNFNATTFGQYSGVYYIGYSLVHLPIGILLDRFGPRKVLTICILMAGLGTLPVIISDFWLYPIIGRAFIGMGSAGAILGVFKIIRMCFKEARFTRILGFSVTIGAMGAIYGGGPLNYLCGLMGYKVVSAILIGISVLLAASIYFIVPNIEPDKNTTILSELKQVFGSKKIMLICFLSGLMVGPIEGFADVWGSKFLKQVFGFEDAIASSLPSIIFLGMCFGSPVLGYIVEKSRSMLSVLMGSGILMALGFLFLLQNDYLFSGELLQSSYAVPVFSIIFALIGVCCAYQIFAIYFASTYVKDNAKGLATAVANMIIMLFGYFFHSVIGWVISFCGGTENVTAFKYGIAVIPICLSIAVFGFLMMFLFERKNAGVVPASSGA